MIHIGEYNKLIVDRKVDFGFYLIDEDKNAILLPNRSLDGNKIEIGDVIEAFVYRDSSDRPVATLKKPLIKAGEIAYLEINGACSFGAFADMGLERDILIPLKEQKFKPIKGKKYLLYAYVDKTGRLAATTYIDQYVPIGEGYAVGDEVNVIAYGRGEGKTIRVAIDGKYQGIILATEYFTEIFPGDELKVRVKRIYENGVIGVATRQKRLDEREIIKEKILDYMNKNGGCMSFNDKSNPEDIKKTFNTSKNYFKIALGGLMKEGKIEQNAEGTKLK